MGFDGLINSSDAGAATAETLAARKTLDDAIEAYYDDIRHAMLRQGAGPGQATEIVHDLYVQLCRKPERLAGKNSLRAFLIRAALNLGIDRARRSAFERKLFDVLDERAHAIQAKSDPLETRLDMPKRIAVLQRAIFDLPPQCRKVFIAYRIAGMAKPQIAEDLGIKTDSVDRHLRNAMLRCLEAMDAFEEAQSF
ncbi:sigma-70 family RNA polymerase sigma factor [Roseibium aggregatum]|uniref:Sigma-70 family RNA polymerase sigma factor n=1 Tax=Roseibium aggregatum TaxID=187304 RepID=A0A939EFC5_9HYPH|nr:sigma-70 family RNA polymerase sigma factor [Roseibium aggregatum]MBN9672211.1 sigma-70 family RNA polymerase sigma factor [Roseibium aggregatum]